MKILHVISDLAPRHGGPSKVVPELCRALGRWGHDVTLFTTNFDVEGVVPAATDGPVAAPGFTLRYFPVGHPRRWKFSWPLGRALRDRIAEFDVVHLHNLYLFHTAIGAHYCRKYGIPYLISPHGTLDPFIRRRSRMKKAVYNFLVEKRNLNRAAAIHYTTRPEMDLAHQAMRIEAPAVIAPLGLELEDYLNLPPRGTFRSRYPGIGDNRIILFMSRLNFKKGLDLLARAFGRVARQRPDVHLVIAGPDNEGYGNQVRQWLAAEKVLDRVTFTGMLLGQDKLAALREADLFVLPSYSENFGIAVLEALACKLPTIISDQVNIYGEVQDQGAGLVIPCDAARLAEALQYLLDHPPLAREMGEKGHALVRERFQWSKVAQRLEEVYVSLQSAKP